MYHLLRNPYLWPCSWRNYFFQSPIDPNWTVTISCITREVSSSNSRIILKPGCPSRYWRNSFWHFLNTNSSNITIRWSSMRFNSSGLSSVSLKISFLLNIYSSYSQIFRMHSRQIWIETRHIITSSLRTKRQHGFNSIMLSRIFRYRQLKCIDDPYSLLYSSLVNLTSINFLHRYLKSY